MLMGISMHTCDCFCRFLFGFHSLRMMLFGISNELLEGVEFVGFE